MPVSGEVRHESSDFSFAHLGKMSNIVEEDVLLDPVDVCLFSFMAVVPKPDDGAHLLEKLWHGRP
jgi:hypothetical protein